MKEFTVKDLVWTRPPRQFTISDEEITITTTPRRICGRSPITIL